MMAKSGRCRSVFRPRLSVVSSFVSTALSLVSLPAAEMVSTAPSLLVLVSAAFLLQKSQMSVSGLATPWAMALDVSITLPPPTPRMKSAPNASAFCTPSRAWDRRGLGCTPPKLMCSSPASVSVCSMRAISPLFTALWPP